MPSEHLSAHEGLIEARDVSRRYGDTVALSRFSLTVQAGQIHALLGPNGAGKTSLIRILCGLQSASSGQVKIAGLDPATSPRELRRRIGFVPSGDRSFYLRISGLENLAFFARMHGLGRKTALARSRELLRDVGLEDAARKRVGVYSHGMQKRLSVARALLTEPQVLLVDEATHDLDPAGARQVRSLVDGVAARGAAVVWATQRIDEIRGFAHGVTLLRRGEVAFSGSVPALVAHATPRRYVLQVRNGSAPTEALVDYLKELVTPLAEISPVDREEHVLLTLVDGAILGDALTSLTRAGVHVLRCTDERSELEEAFLNLTGDATQ
jgi:ABC-2 type transport system ATP-binding protein